MSSREELIVFHQQRADELYGFARWTSGKAAKQRSLLEAGMSNLYYVRRNQAALEADMAAKHSATARILMGVE